MGWATDFGETTCGTRPLSPSWQACRLPETWALCNIDRPEHTRVGQRIEPGVCSLNTREQLHVAEVSRPLKRPGSART